MELLTKKGIEKKKAFKMVIKRMLSKLENRVSVGAVVFARYAFLTLCVKML